MADGQTVEVPEASVESRLGAFFSEQDEAPPVETAEVEAQSEETTENAEEVEATEQEAEEEFVDIEDYAGKTHKVPAALKEGFMRKKEYMRETARVTDLAKSAEDRLQYAEAREHAYAAVMSEVAEFNALKAKRDQYDQVDWGALYNADLGQAVKLRDQRDQLDKQIAEKSQAIQGKAGQVQEMQKKHFGNQWQMAVDGAKKALGQYSEVDDQAAATWAQARHFTESELKGRFADARVLEAIHKAAKWDSLQAGKPGAVSKAHAAPPVIKPGAIGKPQAGVKDKVLRDRLRSKGGLQDAAALLAHRMR